VRIATAAATATDYADVYRQKQPERERGRGSGSGWKEGKRDEPRWNGIGRDGSQCPAGVRQSNLPSQPRLCA